jgi:N utilization substance protein A
VEKSDMVSDLARMIDQVSREKAVEQDVLVKALEEAVKAAARKKYGPDYDLEVTFNEELGEIEVFEFKEVSENVTNEHVQISLEEAHKMDPESEFGDSLGIKMDTDTFGRIAAQSAKFDRGSIIVNLGRTEAELPPKEQVPKESYKQGDRIRAYILDVRQFSRGPQIILSRTHPNFVSALFENEVPEIPEGIVQVMQVAVVQELRGEKIDIVTWHPDSAKFICNALAPAEIIRVIVDEDNRSMEVVVQDDQLSLAIGKRGQNVRLASRLSGWRLDVNSESNYNQTLKDGYKSLLELPGVGEKRAADLYEEGFRSSRDVAGATVADLVVVDGISEKGAEKLIESAIQHIHEETARLDSEKNTESEDTALPDSDESVSEVVSDGEG